MRARFIGCLLSQGIMAVVACIGVGGCADGPAKSYTYLCDSFRDCAGGIVPRLGEPYVTTASTPEAAGRELEAACEADPCPGFLSCAARCVDGSVP
jgi:hypothetical protein